MSSSDIHRNLVQLLLERGVFSETDLLDLLAQCVNAYPDDAKRAKIRLTGTAADKEVLQRVVKDEISQLLDPLAMKVAKSRSKADKQVYYGLVNMRDDASAQLATSLSAKEQEFFHRLLSEMAGDEHHGSIEAQEAAGIGRDLSSSNRMGASEAQECLKRLEEGQWLARSDDGVYSVGIRCELQRMYTHDAPQAQAAAQVD